MDRYQKVEKPKAETAISENELRITAQGRLRNYISYAISLFQVCERFIVIVLHSFRACTFCVVYLH